MSHIIASFRKLRALLITKLNSLESSMEELLMKLKIVINYLKLLFIYIKIIIIYFANK